MLINFYSYIKKEFKSLGIQTLVIIYNSFMLI